jgi:hypothetical protein
MCPAQLGRTTFSHRRWLGDLRLDWQKADRSELSVMSKSDAYCQSDPRHGRSPLTLLKSGYENMSSLPTLSKVD